jgi:hypothetical protein
VRRHHPISGTVGVPQQHLPALAALEIAGAAGILLGRWLEPLGVLAAAGLATFMINPDRDYQPQPKT